MPPSEQAMQQYLDRCMTLLVQLDGVLASTTLGEAQHLMDHGEPSIGIEYLAHGIVEQRTAVPAEIVAALRELVLDPADLPPDLDAHIRM